MKKISFLFLFYFFSLFFLVSIIFLISSNLVYAVGVSGPNYEQRILEFEPNGEVSFSFGLVDAEKIHAVVEGDFKEYATIIDDAPDSGPRTVTLNINFPSEYAPGKYILYFRANEMPLTQNAMGALASIRLRIPINVFYPGKFPEISFKVDDLNVNETTDATLTVTNFGLQDIVTAQGIIDVFDEQNNKLTTIYTNFDTIKAKETKDLVAKFDSSKFGENGLSKGVYHATAQLHYDNSVLNDTKTASFRIGTLNMEVIDWTKEVYFDAVNKFEITIESDWSGKIEDVYAKIITSDGKVLKTPNVDAENFQKAKLETYWDTKGLPTGEQEVTIELFYGGKTTSKIVKVNIIEGIPPVIEKPSKSFELNTTMILIGVIVVLLILVVLNMFLLFKRNNNNGNNNNGNNNNGNNNGSALNQSQSPQPPKLK